MNNIYITQFSIGFISPAILCLIICGAIVFSQIKSRKFTPDRVSLSLYFAGASAYNILNFFGFSVYSAEAQVVWYIESFAPFAVLFMVRFAYHYPTGWRESERKAVLISGSIISAAAITEYWINSWDSPVMLYGQTYGSEYHSSAIPLVIALFYLWAASVFVRRAVSYEIQKGLNGKLLKVIISPVTREAGTARTFACLILLDIVHSFIVYGEMNRIPLSIFIVSLSTTVVMLLIYSLYSSVYLHSAYDNIPVIYKLTGIPLVIILLMVTASGYMMMFFRSISYDEMNRAIISELKIDERSGLFNGVLPVSYISIAGENAWKVIYDKNGDIPETINSGLWREAPGGVQVKTGRGLETFNNIEPGGKYFLQINNINYHQYNRKIAGKIYGFGIPYLDYLKYMHKTGRLILSVMIVSILLILAILPLLYYFGIIHPLRQIIRSSTAQGLSEPLIENELNYIEKILKNSHGVKRGRPFPEKPEELSSAVCQKLEVIVCYLKENYHDDISREGLASMIDLDPDYISRLFKIYTGMRIGDYINKLRIEEAVRLLVSTDMSVIDICMTAGFESLRTFNRSFFRITGKTPTSFKNKNTGKTGQKQ